VFEQAISSPAQAPLEDQLDFASWSLLSCRRGWSLRHFRTKYQTTISDIATSICSFVFSGYPQQDFESRGCATAESTCTSQSKRSIQQSTRKIVFFCSNHRRNIGFSFAISWVNSIARQGNTQAVDYPRLIPTRREC
jgi:hypothetical protein